MNVKTNMNVPFQHDSKHDAYDDFRKPSVLTLNVRGTELTRFD